MKKKSFFLLLQNQLGRPKNRAYTQVPNGSFVFGRPNEQRVGGADDGRLSFEQEYGIWTFGFFWYPNG